MSPNLFVFLPGLGSQDPTWIKFLSQVLRLAAIDAKMILGARTPRRVGSFVKKEDADKLVRELAAGGLRAFILEKAEFAKKPFVVRAKGMEFRKDGVAFKPIQIEGPAPALTGSPELYLPKDAVSAFIVGLFVNNRARAVAEGRWVTTQTTSTGEGFLHVYWGSSDGFLELRHSSFDYTCLARSARDLSGGANFASIVQALRGLYPKARFDDTLLQRPGDIDVVTSVFPVDWNVGPSMSGMVTASQTASNEPIAMLAARVVARSIQAG